MNQSRNLYIIKTWIKNHEIYSQISNINQDIFSDFEHKSHDKMMEQVWKEKIGKKSCFQKSYTSNIIIWTNSMDLCVFLNKMAFKNMTCKLTYVLNEPQLNAYEDDELLKKNSSLFKFKQEALRLDRKHTEK